MNNEIEVVGRIGKDPVLEMTKSGIPVLRFSVCENIRVKKGEAWETIPQWHHVAAWRDLAENAETVLKSGLLVFVKGSVRMSTYQNKEGQERENRTIQAELIAQVIPGWKKKDTTDAGFDEMGQDSQEEVPF